MNFKNKVVIVTGASSGIGAAAAILFTKDGAKVAMVGINQKELDEVAAECSKTGEAPLVINADVTKDDDAKKIITTTIEKYGKIDILVNNAGMGKYGALLSGDYIQAYDAVMDVNVRAVINITMLAVPHLVASKGNIINISSVASMKPAPMITFGPYSVSKAALDHFTRNAAKELASSGIRVNSVNPGPVITDFYENSQSEIKVNDLTEYTALNRVSTSEEIADMIAYLAGDKAKGITGSVFVVDNGYLLK